MPRPTQLSRSYTISRATREYNRPALTRRPLVRSEAPVVRRTTPVEAVITASGAGFQPDPYVDYGRFLTPEGGVLIIHKDHDLRFRHTLWRLFAWTLATGAEAWFLLHQPLLRTGWIIVACIVAVAFVNWLIVRKPVEVYRRVELRPDCMIIEGTDVFWRKFMECGWPKFRSNDASSRTLCGIYGTRFVEYLTVRRFDEFDRGVEVFISHFQNAMQQLWTRMI